MQRVLKFIGGGLAATVVDYVVYTLFVMVIFGGDVGMAWLASIFLELRRRLRHSYCIVRLLGKNEIQESME